MPRASRRRSRRSETHSTTTTTATGPRYSSEWYQWPMWATGSSSHCAAAERMNSPRLVKPTMTASIQYCERIAARGSS